LLSLGDLLHTLADPGASPQPSSQFGKAVAADGGLLVVGSPLADLEDKTDAGCAYVFSSSTGALLATLRNPAPSDSDYFGAAVAISGTKVVVGAVGEDTGADNAGIAYVFDAVTGTLLRTLNNPDPQYSDYFGNSVGISGNVVAVGAYGDDAGASGAGAAYVLDATTGAVLQTLTHPTPVESLCFGYSVAISGTTVVVGAYLDDTSAIDAGSAYVFDSATGSLVRTLNNPTPAASDWFGYSVAISGSIVVIGAHGDDTGAADSGTAYVFDAATGSLRRTLNNPSPAASDWFGYSVAISSSTAVVGAHGDDTGAADSGTAYVFDAATGNLRRTLNNPSPAASDSFGYSVAASGSTSVVGAFKDDTGGVDAGTAHVFDGTTGNLRRTLINPTPAPRHYFGSSVALSGTVGVVGASGDGDGAGAAYVVDAVAGTVLRALANPAPANYDSFGHAVAVSGSIAVVGAYGKDTAEATDAGAAYVFNIATGSLLVAIDNPFPTEADYFGYSVAISGNTVVVGAYQDDTDGSNAGVAYIFDATTGALRATLHNPTPTTSDFFGHAVAISGNTIVIAAPCDDTGASDAGAAYVFSAVTGNLLATLNNPTPEAFEHFGNAVAVFEDTIVVAAYGEQLAESDPGAVYVFDAATGNLRRTLTNPAPEAGDRFGYSVAVSAGTIVVGTPYDESGAEDSGAAYVYGVANGNLLATLANPTPAQYDYFGSSVAVSATLILVGAPNQDDAVEDRGTVLIFDGDQGQSPTDITLSTSTVAEHVPLGTAIGDFATSDPDSPNDSHTYTLVLDQGEADGRLFAIQGNTLRTAAPMDYEWDTSYQIRVRSTDRGGLFTEKAFTISVTDVQERQRVFTGTSGDDRFKVAAGPQYWVVFNGQAHEVRPDEWDEIVFDGGEGNDQVLLFGDSTDEIVDLEHRAGRYASSRLVVRASNAEYITAKGGGGHDVANFRDTPADDKLTAFGTSASLVGSGVINVAEGFAEVYAFSTVGGVDNAYLIDSAGDDTFRGTPSMADLQGDGFHHNTEGFEYVHAFSETGGHDVADLYDSAGDDLLVGTPSVARLVGADWGRRAKGFDEVRAYASGGGNDRAKLYDSADDDQFDAQPACATLTGTGFSLLAESFDSVMAFSSAGGKDTAILLDSSGDDQFYATPDYAALYGAGYYNRANAFADVVARATGGGNDTARLFDSTGDDDFYAFPTSATMLGDSFRNRAEAFDAVYAESYRGGEDVAELHGSSEADHFIGTPTSAILFGTGYFVKAKSFGQVDANAEGGDDDMAELYDSALSDLLQGATDWARLSSDSPLYSNWVQGFDSVSATGSGSGNRREIDPPLSFGLTTSGTWDN